MIVQILSSVSILFAMLSLRRASAFEVVTSPQQFGTSLFAMSRREALGTASASAMVVAGVPFDAMAATTTEGNPDKKVAEKYSFNGVFLDPKHPKGYRVLVGAANKKGTLTMQNRPDGEVYSLPVKINKDGKKITLDIDFSSYRQGPKSVIAKVNKDSSISLPGGNNWKKDRRGVVGVYIDGFAPYPKFRRIIRQDTGSALAVDIISGKKVFAVAGQSSKAGVTIDFPGKTCTGKVDAKEGTITWVDGNVWTKV